MRHLFVDINSACLESMIRKQNDLFNTGGKNIQISVRKTIIDHRIAIEFIVECEHFHLGKLTYHILSTGEIINISKK
jgi:hypothetical protein